MLSCFCTRTFCFQTISSAAFSGPRNMMVFNFWAGLWALAVLGAATSLTLSLLQTSQLYADQPAQAWILAGGVTDSSAVFRVYLDPDHHDGGAAKLVIADNPDLLEPVFQRVLLLDDHNNSRQQHGIHAITVDGRLEAATRYYYAILFNNQSNSNSNEEATAILRGTLRTSVPEGTRHNFTVAMGGCAMTGSRMKVFDVIAADEQPDLFFHLGDFHYRDIGCNCLDQRLDAVHTVLNSEPQAALYRSTALVNMWDDHDWIGNDSGFRERVPGARDTALASYQMLFPHYPLAQQQQQQAVVEDNTTTTTTNSAVAAVPPYHAFTYGTVRFIVSDLRSESTPAAIFSDTQRSWLLNELSRAAEYDFVVWVTTKPWIGEDDVDIIEDSWMGHPGDRAELSDAIAQAIGGDDGPQNLIAVSADAHMLALDDGSNTYYGNAFGNDDNDDVSSSAAASSVLSFPILQSGPLDRIGSAKGGPFTSGCTSTSMQQVQQYSTIEFEMPEDEESEACMNIKGYRVEHASAKKHTVFTKRLCGKIFRPSHAGTGSCTIQTHDLAFAKAEFALLGLSVVGVLSASASACYYFAARKSLWITLFLFCTWCVTMLVGLGAPYLKSVEHFNTLASTSAAFGQSVCLTFWVAYWGRREPNRSAEAEKSDADVTMRTDVMELEEEM